MFMIERLNNLRNTDFRFLHRQIGVPYCDQTSGMLTDALMPSKAQVSVAVPLEHMHQQRQPVQLRYCACH